MAKKKAAAAGSGSGVQTKGQATRERILEAATDLFLELGFYEITLGKIAEGAGLTQPAIYRHFSDMDEIILAACRHWVGKAQLEIDTGMDDLAPAGDQLHAYIRGNLTYSAKHRAQDGLLIGLYHYSMRSKKMLETYREIKEGGIHRIEKILRFGVIDGSWELARPKELAEFIHSVLVGEIMKHIIEPKSETSEVRVRRVWQTIQKILN